MRIHIQDKIFKSIISFLALSVLFLFCTLFIQLAHLSLPAFSHLGTSFFFTKSWNPVSGEFGILALVYGTLFSSFLALLIATPISIGSALIIVEFSSGKLSKFLGFLIEMLAAIPSIVYGLWGLFILTPWIRTSLGPFLNSQLGYFVFFQGPIFGVGMLAAGLILAIMIIPTITSISREVLKAIPKEQKEASLALGATRWEMIQLSLLKGGRQGLFAAMILGLGRALGETMAVTMVIGNRIDISPSLFAPSQTMASLIANEYAEAADPLYLSALAGVGFSLLLISFLTYSIARWIIFGLKTNTSHK